MLSLCMILTGCRVNKALSLEEALLQSGQTDLSQEEADQTGETMDVDDSSLKIVVYVCGSVKLPGVYELPINSRIVAAIEAAGGFREDAATEAINLAEPLKDGMQVRVSSVNEVTEENLLNERAVNGMVNINSATEEQLCTLPGIGKSKALSIIAYREENGPFQSTEDIRNVSGIGDSLYAQIEDRIYIE